MKEIRIHARAGQGAITTATILARAAFEQGKHALAFPAFGASRTGAPMNAFVRLSDSPIRLRSQIQQPDYIIVQDATLFRGFDVISGLKPEGAVIINEDKSPAELGLKTRARVVTVPASKIALEVLGRADRGNTALLGAFVAATGEVNMQALEKAIRARFPGKDGDKNLEAAQQAYDLVKAEESQKRR